MGLVRKTLSIGTLGLVDFRSKKELLRRAEADLADATDELEREQVARSLAEGRIAVAERRTTAAELQALAAAKRAAKLRGKKGKQARSLIDRLGDAFEAAEPKVKAGADEAKVRGRRARKKAEKAAKNAQVRSRKAAKQAKKAAADAQARAKVEAKRARKAAEPYLDLATDVAIDVRDDVVDRGRKARKAAEKATAGRS